MIASLCRLVLLVLALGAALPALAQSPAPPNLSERLQSWDSQAKTIERKLEFEEQTLDDLSDMRRTLEAQLAEIPGARREVQPLLQPLKDQLAALGAPPEDPSTEAPQIALERKRLSEEIARLEARIKQIDQAAARAEGLVQRLTDLRRDLFTDRLQTRGPSLFDAGMIETALDALARKGGVIVLETRTRLADLDIAAPRLVGAAVLAAMVIALVIGLVRLRNMVIRTMLRRIREDTPRSSRVAAGAGIALARLILPSISLSIVFGAIWLSGLLGGQGQLLLIGLAKGTAVVIGAYALGGAFFAPHAPLLRLSILSDTDAVLAHRWLILVAGIVGLDRALVQEGQEMGLAVEGLALLNTSLLILGGITLWNFLRHIRPPRPEPVPRTGEDATEEEVEEAAASASSFARSAIALLRFLGRAAAVLAPLLSLAGYYVAARYTFFPVVFSGAVIGLCVLLYHLVRTLVDQLVLSEGEGEGGPDRLRLIPIGVGFLLFCAALPVLALIWGANVTDLGVLWRYVVAGFKLGEVTIAPLDFVVFAAILVIGVIVTRRLKAVLRRSVLPYTGLDQGGRDAVAAGAGYVGIVIVALVAISSAGIDLSNLAIVAGALSVGIGFGLQNIVNNFVSGIILLIERPIKAGDWIELPSGMGYVKTINVRSTEVETFDRASLFVPNSALIAENVINWTHSNLNGRIIAPVSVAHGSDLRKVERILLEIARAHPLMLRRPAPFVLLRRFTPDAVDFEIRGILRDVNWILNVHSDINFEIARRFAEEGIRIPFRQSDVHVSGAETLGAGLARGWCGDAPEPAEPAPAAPPGPPRLHSEPARDPDGGAGEGR